MCLLYSGAVAAYDRNVRISRPKLDPKTDVRARQSKRPSNPVQHFNYGEVLCSVCKKKFTGDIPTEYYVGGIVCSVKCLQRANQL